MQWIQIKDNIFGRSSTSLNWISLTINELLELLAHFKDLHIFNHVYIKPISEGSFIWFTVFMTNWI